MSQVRIARLALMLAAIGLNAAPALMPSALAQKAATVPTAPPPPKDAPTGANAAAQPKADAVRPELFKLLDPTQLKPLLDAKNYTEVQSRLTQAEAVADKTPYEVYVLNRMKLTLATATGDEKGQQ